MAIFLKKEWILELSLILSFEWELKLFTYFDRIKQAILVLKFMGSRYFYNFLD